MQMSTTIHPKVSRPLRGLELVPFFLQALLPAFTFGAVSPMAPVATFPTRGFLAPNGLLQNAFGGITPDFTGRLLTSTPQK